MSFIGIRYNINYLFILLVISLLGCNEKKQLGNQDTTFNFIEAAKNTFPNIDKYEINVIVGDLNNDQLEDAIIEYGIGEGNKSIGKNLIIALKHIGTKVSFYQIEPDYCPAIKELTNKKVIINEFETCVHEDTVIVAKHYLYLKDQEIVDTIYWTPYYEFKSALEKLTHHVITKSKYEIHDVKYKDIDILRDAFILSSIAELEIENPYHNKGIYQKLNYDYKFTLKGRLFTLDAWVSREEDGIKIESRQIFIFELNDQNILKLIQTNFAG